MYEQLKSPFHCDVKNVMFKIDCSCAFALLCELCDLDTCSLDRVCIKMPWDCCLSCERGVVVGLLAALTIKQTVM